MSKVSFEKKRGDWSPYSWTAKPMEQVPHYEDQDKLKEVMALLASYPPLVFAGEARNLKKKLADVCQGRAFLLQGGDCAESFNEFDANTIRNSYRILLKLAVVLTYGLSV
ncbi:MAG: 3-deoxy-7-phosphoheptulonate synthase, partial [Bdellovibrionales bacterium]|nr:3-deoxy-7-phosphoheptulonate synthase [Bdellovibrionales bacterium]